MYIYIYIYYFGNSIQNHIFQIGIKYKRSNNKDKKRIEEITIFFFLLSLGIPVVKYDDKFKKKNK